MTPQADSTPDEQPPDGGGTSDSGRSNPHGSSGSESNPGDAATVHENTNYLEAEVNILRPSTPFMRDHLRLIWVGFLAWTLVIFGPVTATYVAPETMTETTFLGFPLHYFLVAIGGPGGALLLSVVYSWRRDRLDRKYGIDHDAPAGTPSQEASGDSEVATDGGVRETNVGRGSVDNTLSEDEPCDDKPYNDARYGDNGRHRRRS